MQEDREWQPSEDARSRSMILGEIRRVLRRVPAARPRTGIPRRSIANGYFDADGNFQQYWLSGDIVTEDGSDSNTIAP